MKKIILLISIIGILLFSVNNTFAEKPIEVAVPIDFSSVFKSDNEKGINCTSKKPYECTVPKGTTGFQVVMSGIIKYAIFIASLAGVLFIVINGIMYSMAGLNDSFKTEAKDRITKTLIGIVLLLMSGTILHILAPWVYK